MARATTLFHHTLGEMRAKENKLKIWFAVIVGLSLAGTAKCQYHYERLPQDLKKLPDLAKVAYYFENKKEVGTGVGMWCVFPGIGEFYADNDGLGLVYLAVDGSLVAIALSKTTTAGARTGVIVGFAASRVIELATIISDINEYNADIRIKLGLLRVAQNNIQPALQLSVSF